MAKDYYNILGIEKKASKDEIKNTIKTIVPETKQDLVYIFQFRTKGAGRKETHCRDVKY